MKPVRVGVQVGAVWTPRRGGHGRGSCPLQLSLACSHWTLSWHSWILPVLQIFAGMSLPCHPSHSSHRRRQLLSIPCVFISSSPVGPLLEGHFQGVSPACRGHS